MTDRALVITGATPIGRAEGDRRDLWVSDGRLVDDLPPAIRRRAIEVDASGCRVGPGLVDLQVNGAGGVDLSEHPERWMTVAAALARAGTTAFCPTLVTGPEASLSTALAEFERARRSGDPLAAMLCGAHVEGPFISTVRTGAHESVHVRPPDPAEIDRWLAIGGLSMVTLAPEVDGALDAVRRLTAAGVVVSLGHSDATAGEAVAALDAGAGAVTHLFNAMGPFHHREPGLAGVALTDPRPVVTLIADGVHVDRRAVELAWTALGPRRRCLVSDSVATTLAGHDLAADGAVARTVHGALAGSTRCLADAVRWVVREGIASLDEAWHAASTVPAELIGRTDLGHLRPGARADLTIIDADLDVRTTIVAGRMTAGSDSD